MGEESSKHPVVQGLEAVSNVLLECYKDVAHPWLKPIGQALGTVFDVLPTSLLTVRFWTEKKKLNFAKRIEEYARKLDDIPEANRIEVAPEVGTPIVEKLTYTTNDEIADLFTTLLANASSSETVNRAHPGFVDMIGRMSVDEARIIRYLKSTECVHFCSLRGFIDDVSFRVLADHETLLTKDIDLDFPQNVNAYISNLVSMGVLEDMGDLYKMNEPKYDTITEMKNLEMLRNMLVPKKFTKIEVVKGYYEITPWGRLFIKACVKEEK